MIIFLSLMLLIGNYIYLEGADSLNDFIRALMFFIVGYFFYLLNEKILGLIGNIRDNLREKEILLTEIHHRVKNNLQVISSLVSLQMSKTGDEAAIELINEINNRVYSMALVHEKLYQKDNLELINFREFINEIISHLMNSYNIYDKNIQFRVNVADIHLNVNMAIPCALIINEIISNSLKHAFKNREKGEIEINFSRVDNSHYKMTISDNGPGFPEGVKIKDPESMGLELINVLTTQLKGDIELDKAKGVRYELIFSENSEYN